MRGVPCLTPSTSSTGRDHNVIMPLNITTSITTASTTYMSDLERRQGIALKTLRHNWCDVYFFF